VGDGGPPAGVEDGRPRQRHAVVAQLRIEIDPRVRAQQATGSNGAVEDVMLDVREGGFARDHSAVGNEQPEQRGVHSSEVGRSGRGAKARQDRDVDNEGGCG